MSDITLRVEWRQRASLDNDHCDTIGVEVTSRKLFVNRDVPVPSDDTTTDHQHTITTAEEIKTVLGALHQAFNSPTAAGDSRRAQWLAINNSCGLHVHVGNDEAGFPLQTIKNLLSLYTAFERVIDKMHTQWRIGGTGLALYALDAFDSGKGTNTTSREGVEAWLAGHEVPINPLTEFFIGKAWCQRRDNVRLPWSPSDDRPRPTPADSGLHTTAFVEVIQSAPDLDKLARSEGPTCILGKRSTINIMYLLPEEAESEHRSKTIEFRQHAAVTTVAETLPWIDFVVALVEYAHASSAELIRKACMRAANDPELSVGNLLALLPMCDETGVYWSDRVEGKVPFFDQVAARAEVEVAFGTSEDDYFMRSVALDLVNERKKLYERSEVDGAIRHKFIYGGYGQFSRGFLNIYAPYFKKEEKVELKIGWETPLSKPESEPEPEPEPEDGSEFEDESE